MKNATGILARNPENPILTPKDFDNGMAVFNPSPVVYNGKTLLVLSVFKFEPNNPVGGYIAESDDGVHFTVREKPLIDLQNAPYPFNLVQDSLVDSRFTKIEDTYYFVNPVDTDWGSYLALLGCTKDFQTYKSVEIILLAPNRGISLFPEEIHGKYYRLDRPGAGNNFASIWLASSLDLIHWCCFRPVLQPGYAFWNQVKIGPTPPIKTPEGWLSSMACDRGHIPTITVTLPRSFWIWIIQ